MYSKNRNRQENGGLIYVKEKMPIPPSDSRYNRRHFQRESFGIIGIFCQEVLLFDEQNHTAASHQFALFEIM